MSVVRALSRRFLAADLRRLSNSRPLVLYFGEVTGGATAIIRG